VHADQYPFAVWENWIEQSQLHPPDPSKGLKVPNSGASKVCHPLHESPLALALNPSLALKGGLLGAPDTNCNKAGAPPTDQPNQVWAADITYIPMQQGFLYLVAIIDWATRRVLSWRLSNTLTAGFCVEALSEALARFGKPGIFNTAQGAQFTSDEFTQILRDHGIEISTDGRGRCHDNIFVERLWWTVKHEWVYLRPAANGIEQKRSLAEFFDWYNLRRPHQALGWHTPNEAYLGQSLAATALAA
jgi:transposase InsO family protein